MSGNWELREFSQGHGEGRLSGSVSLLTVFLLILMAMLACGIGWAYVARLEEVAVASGRIIPSGRARIVQSLEGGIVRQIHVREGDVVAAGDSLVTIDDTGSSANLGELMAQRAALSARAARLGAEASGKEPDFAAAGLDPSSPQVAQEEALFRNRLASQHGQRLVIETQIRQRGQEIAEMEATLPLVAEAMTLLEEEIDLRQRSGVMARAQILPLERERTAKRQEQESMTRRLEQGRTALAEAEAQLQEFDLTRQTEISTERSDTINQLTVVDESVRRARDVVTRANLRAPVDGVVSMLNVNTIGGVIGPGQEVLRLVPQDEQLQVEARVRPEDIAYMRPGLPAKVKLTSFDFTTYGSLPGEVVRVGVDAEQDEATGEIYFPIIVQTTENQLTRNGKTFEIRPGMVASVDVMTGEHTVLDYLLKPIRRAQEEALRER